MLSTKSIDASDAAIGPVYVDGGMLAVLSELVAPFPDGVGFVMARGSRYDAPAIPDG